MAAETLFPMIGTWAKQIRIAAEPEDSIPHSLEDPLHFFFWFPVTYNKPNKHFPSDIVAINRKLVISLKFFNVRKVSQMNHFKILLHEYTYTLNYHLIVL